MSSPMLEPGTRLVGRYRLEELLELDEGTGTASWRAVDEVLSRAVNVRTLAAGTGRADSVLAAAQAAAGAHDHRFLRVLDASTDSGVVYVVSEWVQGRTLAAALRAGPLPPAEGARVVGEVAVALASAHAVGLAHLCLVPTSVLIADSGQVKVVGLGVDAAVRGAGARTAADAAATDARGCGALLYAALTGRWPLAAAAGHSALPTAPREHGRVCTPRQVRGGVPRDIDAAAVRALGGPEGGAGALLTPAALAHALAPHHGTGARTWHGWDEGRRDDERAARAPGPGLLGQGDPAPAAAPAHLPPVRTRRGGWSLLTTAVLAAATLGAAAATGMGAGTDRAASAGAGAGPQVTVETVEPDHGAASGGSQLEVVAVTDLDPTADRGDGEENPDQVGNVLDGDPATTWRTGTYFNRPNLGGLKPGVGLVLDLGQVRPVGAVTIRLVGRGTGLELRAAESRGGRAADYGLVLATDGESQLRTVRLREPRRARYLLVWLTSLPRVGGDDYRGEISEIVVRS